MTGRLVNYSGRVQGVGFRATAASLARKWPISGWVKNRPNGSVQLLVEGQETDVEAFLQALRDYWGGYIENEEIEAQTPTGQYRSFEITR